MQIFNLINCRKLKSYEANVFRDFFNNWLFILIFVITLIMQYIFVEFGGQPLNCTPLTASQHIFCLIVGVGALLFGMLFRFVPLSIFKSCGISVGKIKEESTGSFLEFIRRKKEKSIMNSKHSINSSD